MTGSVTYLNLYCPHTRTVLVDFVPLQVLEDAKKEVPPPDAIIDGGNDPVQRATTFAELALVLSSGLDDEHGMVTLFKVRAL
jgi:hypothetical protein